ncbi:Sucrose transport protein [Arachis hypogaea]|nr:Sucrose transport protein [Arachis hypogaea]
MSHTEEVHLSGIPNSTKIGISYAIWTALTRWIPTVMEATKTSFHTEIGSTGMELDSVGELMAIEEKGLPPTKASPLCARFRILSSLCPIPSTSFQTLFFVPSNIPSLLSQEFTEFTDRIRLHTGGANLSAVGATIAFLTIGFAKDIGYTFGNNLSEYTQYRALIIFGIGLWMLEISINMIDVRCRDFLDDLASRNQPKIRLAYQFFSFIMAVENELGYLAALFSRFDVMLAFTMTKACDRFCANAKNISIFSILLLPLLTAVALSYIQNKLALPEEESSVREEEDD